MEAPIARFIPLNDPGVSRRNKCVLWLLVAAISAGCGTPDPRTPTGSAVTLPAEPVSAASSPEIDEPIPDTVVYAKFQSNVQAIKPGSKFLLAVYLDIVGDYRISWTNPGDVGRGTRVKFKVPRGFTVGPVQFPAPKRFVRDDGAVSYGYEGDTAVFAEVRAPRKLSSSKVYRFDVDADWVACKKECATEEINAWFELISQRNAPKGELSQELKAHYAAVPRAFHEHPTSTHDWKSKRSLVLHASDTKWLDFFPGSLDQPKVLKLRKSSQGLELRFEKGPREPIVGLAIAEVEGQTAFFDVRVASPSP